MSLLLTDLSHALAYAVADADGNGPTRRARMTETDQTPPRDERQKEDAQLVARMAQGDKTAFAAIYDRFSRPLYATALRVVNDATEAQDVVHDVFITLGKRRATFQTERGTAFGWAVTLVRNRAIDRVRTRRRRAELLADSAPADLGYDETAPGSGADDNASPRRSGAGGPRRRRDAAPRTEARARNSHFSAASPSSKSPRNSASRSAPSRPASAAGCSNSGTRSRTAYDRRTP